MHHDFVSFHATCRCIESNTGQRVLKVELYATVQIETILQSKMILKPLFKLKVSQPSQHCNERMMLKLGIQTVAIVQIFRQDLYALPVIRGKLKPSTEFPGSTTIGAGCSQHIHPMKPRRITRCRRGENSGQGKGREGGRT